jgi:hypothetical protein
MATVLKTVVGQLTVGSNPTPSANNMTTEDLSLPTGPHIEAAKGCLGFILDATDERRIFPDGRPMSEITEADAVTGWRCPYAEAPCVAVGELVCEGTIVRSTSVRDSCARTEAFVMRRARTKR